MTGADGFDNFVHLPLVLLERCSGESQGFLLRLQFGLAVAAGALDGFVEEVLVKQQEFNLVQNLALSDFGQYAVTMVTGAPAFNLLGADVVVNIGVSDAVVFAGFVMHVPGCHGTAAMATNQDAL